MDILIEFFSKLHNIRDLILWGGYVILAIIIFAETGLFFGFFLPGDSLLVTAGLFAGKGDLNIWFLFILLSVMAVAGDAVGYWFGRITGPKIFTKEQSLLFDKKHLARAQFFYEKYGSKIIILARFMPIIRTFAPIVAGVGQMPYKKFVSFNIIGGVMWIGSMLGIGYCLGSIIPNIEKKLDIIIPLVIVASLLPGVVEYIRHRKDRAQSEDRGV